MALESYLHFLPESTMISERQYEYFPFGNQTDEAVLLESGYHNGMAIFFVALKISELYNQSLTMLP